MRTRFLACLLACIAIASSTPVKAAPVPIGTMANWAATPTVVAGDKAFTYLSSAGGWDGTENLFLTANGPLDSHSLNMLLQQYAGPKTLTVSYRVDVISSYVFKSVALDQTHTGDNVITTKDVFETEEDLLANPVPGSGTLATLLAVNNIVPDFTPLPPIQSIFVRDTIDISATGAVTSVANTYVQAVPEPGTYALAGVGIALAAARGLRRRLTAATKA